MIKIPAGRQRGYTLIEALVAIAIIGMISLVAVPNFIVYYRSGRIKASLREFTTQIRSARQIAVSEQGCSMISFLPGTTTDASRTYTIYRGAYSAGACSGWSEIDTKILQESVYFRTTEFEDDVDEPSGAGLMDIVFKPNGTTVTDPTEARDVVLYTTFDVPKNAFNIEVFPSGQLKVTEP